MEKKLTPTQQEKAFAKVLKNLSRANNVQKLKKILVVQVGKALNADRCIIRFYDDEKDLFLPIDKESEYLKSPDIGTILDTFHDHRIQKWVIDFFSKHKKIVMFSQVTDMLYGTVFQDEAQQVLKQWKLKNSITAPITHNNKFIGTLSLHYVENNYAPSKDELSFLKAIAEQTGVVIAQIKTLQEKEASLKREQLSHKITNMIRSSLDINNVLNLICKEISTTFKVQRVTLTQTYFCRDKITTELKAEYKQNTLIKGIGEDKENIKTLGNFWNEYLVLGDTHFESDNIQGADLPENIRKIYQNMGVKSALGFAIKGKNERWGFIFLSEYNKYRTWNKEEINFIEGISGQIYIALNQAQLYEELKQKAKREETLREITNDIRNSFNTEEILHTMIFESAKILKAQRAFFSKYDHKKNVFLIPEPDKEYLESKAVKSYTQLGTDDFEQHYTYFCDIVRQGKSILSKNINEYISQHNWGNTPDANTLNMFNVKCFMALPLKYQGELLGAFVFNFDKPNAYSSDDEKFISTVTAQAEVAIRQSLIYEKQLSTNKRERLLREVIEQIRSSLDIQEAKKNIVTKVGETFNADRCYFRSFHKKNDRFLPPDVEYLSSKDINSLLEAKINQAGLKFFSDEAKRLKTFVPLVINQKYLDDNNLRKSDLEIYFNECDIKTDIAIPMWDKEDELSFLVLHYKDNIESILQEDLQLMEAIAKQVVIAINQSRAYAIEQNTAKRERLLRESIEAIRSSMDINQVKQNLVNTIGIGIDADICIMRDKKIKEDGFHEVSAEYRKDKTSRNLLKMEELEISKLHTGGKELLINDVDKFLMENSFTNTKTKKFFKEHNIHAGFGVPIYYQNQLLGLLAVMYTSPDKEFTNETTELIRAFAAQAGVALYQAMLYDTQQKTARRERLLRETIEATRSSINPEEMKQNLVEKIGKGVEADLCFITEYDSDTNRLLPPQSEYKSTTSTSSVKCVDLEALSPTLAQKAKKRKEILICNADKYIKTHHLKNTDVESFLDRFNVSAGFSIPLLYQNELVGALAIIYHSHKNVLSEETLTLIRSLAGQTGIALHQAKLFDKIQRIAKKESALRDVISELKLTRNLEEAYQKLLMKTAQFFDVPTTLFVQPSQLHPEILTLKHQYIKNKENMISSDAAFPQECLTDVSKLAQNNEVMAINEVQKSALSSLAKHFFSKNKVKSLMIAPLIKYNGNANILGFVLVCSNKKRNWSEYEANLLKAISESVIGVLWEIIKFIELEELRNSFILTLAHDFQVPLIGEKRAIEFLIEMAQTEDFKYTEILQELLENNVSIVALLDKSIDIYNYESGNKTLELEIYEAIDIINSPMRKFKDFADSKQIDINFDSTNSDTKVHVDLNEAQKAFSPVIENAIENSNSGETVTIKCTLEDSNIVISVHNPQEIPEQTQQKIFKRYEMLVAIERKIGGGTGLFLSKHIIEAHSGLIWFESTPENGTTFHISLPIAKV